MNVILNSKERLAVDGSPHPVQVAPFGEFQGVKHKADGTTEPFAQNLDRAAFERILNAWQAKGAPELLVDADHDSANGGSTRAYAWAANLRIESDGLYADFKFTDEGAKVINDREYRFVSPVFSLYEDGEIASLESIALTNRPNLPVSCVLNRESAGVVTVEDTKEKPNMEKILSALGLGPDASEDDAVAAIETMKTKISDAEAAALNAEAEAFAEGLLRRAEGAAKGAEAPGGPGGGGRRVLPPALRAPAPALRAFPQRFAFSPRRFAPPPSRRGAFLRDLGLATFDF